MNKKIVVAILLLCTALSIGCLEEKQTYVQEMNERYDEQEPTEEPIIKPVNESIINESIPVSTTPELDNLIQFLEEDKTDEMIYNLDEHRGIDYFVCCGFARELAKNASEYNITMGGISLRDHEHVRAAKSYHAMNYVIIDNEFIIIEPQSDSIHYLDTIYYHWGDNYQYITIHPDAQIMSNYGKYKQTIDIDVMDYNKTEIINEWR